MLRALVSILLLVLGAVALARGLYIRAELIRQLETGTMGFIRSWVLWSTTDGRELLAWYRMVTPWLIWGGAATLVLGLAVALWPTRPATSSHVREGGSGKPSRDTAAKPPATRRKPRKK